MNSGASWNERGLSPELYQAARDAALRAGMPVEDWLHATFGKAPASAPRSRFQDHPAGARLEGISPQHFESPAPAQRGARLSDTVAKLNARLEQMNGGRGPADADRRAPAETSRPAPPASDDPSLDEVVAEIAARQRALDELAASPATVAPPSLASLEEHLKSIASKIDSLRRPCGVEDAVNSLRAELAEIGRTVNDAMPRHALEGLQSDIRSIAQRVEAGLTRGADISALAGIERRLSEVHERLNSMTPAEGLADVDQRIAELARKMDSVGGGSTDPEMLRYLGGAITELRELSNGVASAEGLAVLAGDIQALGERIDHVAQTTGAAGLDSLATRVSDLTHALDTRVEQMGPMPQNLASLVKSLTDKLDSADNSPRDQAAFEQLERRIMSLADRLETADQRSGELSAIERGIDQLTLQVREAREEAAATAERVARSVAAESPRGANDDFRRDLEALHAHQAASDERTQQTLEALHETLEHLVERLGNLENGMRSAPAHMAEPVRRAEPARAPEPPAALPAQIPSAPPTVPAARPPAFVPAQRSERTPID